jgi:hypothetical protein
VKLIRAMFKVERFGLGFIPPECNNKAMKF